MKRNIIVLISAFLGMVMSFNACQPDKHELGAPILKSELKFSITQNPADPNMIIMVSETPGFTPLWKTPMGRSTLIIDTVKLAFPGDYVFTFGVQSDGGYIESDPQTISITTTNLSYVNDPLWTALSGGVGNSKSWVLDNGKYGFAPGPLSYENPANTVEWNNFTTNWEPAMPPGTTDANMGWGSTMTFSLQNGAYMTTDKLNEGVIQESGTYFLNINTHTLSSTDATILRADNFIANATNWNTDLKILTLTENQLRIAVMRTNSEGPWWYIWNYVSKDWADSYVPDESDPNIPIDLGTGTASDLLGISNTKTWALSSESPFNWADINGGLLNNWNSVADYEAAGWPGYTSANIAEVEACKITFSSIGSVYMKDNLGVEQNGTYTTAEGTNIITFTGATPSFKMGSWAVATTTADNQWKIVKTKLTGSLVTDIWFGKRDPAKPEYMVFHFVLSSGGTASDPGKEMMKNLTNGSSQSWVFDQIVPFTWGRGDTHTLDYTDVVPDWAGYTSPVNIDGISIVLSADGSSVYTEDNGTTHDGVFAVDMQNNRVLFSAEITPNLEICNGWVMCNTYTPGNFWELYKLEYSGTELVGIWFGKPTTTPYTSSSERMCYHFIKP